MVRQSLSSAGVVEWLGLTVEGNAAGPAIWRVGHRFVAQPTGNIRLGARKLPAIPLCLRLFGRSIPVDDHRDRYQGRPEASTVQLLLDRRNYPGYPGLLPGDRSDRSGRPTLQTETH